jgi:hypothetical protein
LSGYFARQLDTIRSLDYETCPGETDCSDTGPIFLARREQPDMPVEDICGGCRFVETKPGSEPAHLAPAIATATELDALKSGGATFAYPDTLTAFEWCCLKALQAGRSESEARGVKERQREVNRDADRNRLDAARRR